MQKSLNFLSTSEMNESSLEKSKTEAQFISQTQAKEDLKA